MTTKRKDSSPGQPAAIHVDVAGNMTDDEQLEAENEQGAFIAMILLQGTRLKGIDFILNPEGDQDRLTKESVVEDVRQAPLIRSLLWNASLVLVSDLFDDLDILSACGDIEETWVLRALPPRYQAYYTPAFTRQFLVSMVEVTRRLACGWEPLASTAQELAFDLLLAHARGFGEYFEVDLPAGWHLRLVDTLFEDMDYRDLYTPIPLFGDNPPENWFTPFDAEFLSAPFAEESM